MEHSQVVFVVDDDEGMRKSLRFLIESVGLEVRTFASSREFLASYDPMQPGCLILDLRLPDKSGLDLQEDLFLRRMEIPIIMVTSYGEVSTAVRALKAGAVDFIQKPFSEQLLLDRINEALEIDRRTRRARARRAELTERLAHLTQRERQVMDLVVAGKRNRVIAEELGLSPKTVEVHRARVMQKMQAESLPALVKLTMPLTTQAGAW